jgi:hypothetical protein
MIMTDMTFELPPPGEGAMSDYRRAGKKIGAEFGRRWIAIHVETAEKGILTRDREEDFQRKAITDMLPSL